MSVLNHFRLDNRVAVVTGALGKLGPFWVEALLEAGAKVAALDLPGARPTPAFEQLQKRFPGGHLRVLAADVTERSSLNDALHQCVRDLGEPAVLVNNAGIDQPPSANQQRCGLHDVAADVCRQILNVNLVGLFLATQVFTRPMVRAGKGSVVNIGSLYAGVSPDPRFYDYLAGEEPFLKPPMYGASKAGVASLGRYLATHLAPRGVRVNTLSPGGVLDNQDDEFQRRFSARVPLARMAVKNDLQGPLLFLASDASAYVTGVELHVDGGFTAW